MRRNEVTTVRTFRSHEKASQWFEEQERTCGNGGRLVNCSTSISTSSEMASRLQLDLDGSGMGEVRKTMRMSFIMASPSSSIRATKTDRKSVV